jgi:hypothetical protein
MKRIHVIGISITIWLLLVAFSLIIAPTNAQGGLAVTADYPSPISTYVLEKVFTDATLSDSIEINVPFRILKGAPRGYNSTIDFTWFVTMDCEDPDRIVSVNYTFFSNDNYFLWIREDFVGALKGTFGGSYLPQNISKPEMLNVGDNELTIRTLIDAKAEKPSKCNFRLEISSVHVKVEALDLDGDRILDPVDPLLGFNNYVGLPIFGIAGIVPIFIAGRRIRKKKR